MKIFKILSLVFLMVAMTNCTDFEMTEEPIGILSPEGFFKTESDVEAAIMGAIGRMATEPYYGRKLSLSIMLLGDMVDIGNRGTPSRRQQVNDFGMDENNGMVSSFWPRSYEIISAANSAINGADIVEMKEERRNELKAEAMFIRSYAYYHLVRLFSDIPYVGEFVSDPGSVASISKTPETEVYDYIIADLEFGIQHLAMEHPYNARNRISQGSARTMLASVYLTLGDYDKAYEHAKWVIDNAGALGYGLMDDYQDIFKADLSPGMKEHIFVVDFVGLTNGFDDLMGALTGIRGSDTQGWGVAVPSQAVYDTWDSNDYRKKVAFDDSTAIGGVQTAYTDFTDEKRPHIAKYTRFSGTSEVNSRRSDQNYIGFRYAEVLLIAAEALGEINNGPTTESLGYINQIRERARNWAGTMTAFPADYTMADFAGKDDFIDAVLDERRLELSFEFKRWYDIKRRDLGTEVFTGLGSLEPHSNFDPGIHYLMPLPAVDLSINPNLRPQNPGYGSDE